MLRIESRGEPEALVRAVPEHEAGDVPAWEQIETGRYMPRRIRGSFPGRELG